MLADVAEDIETTWATSPPELPSIAEWCDRIRSQPKYTESDKHFNLIDLNPDWVILGDGSVLQATGPLPANQGTHLLSGTAVCAGSNDPVSVVLAVDSASGAVVRVSQKCDNQWRDMTAIATSVVPRYAVEETA